MTSADNYDRRFSTQSNSTTPPSGNQVGQNLIQIQRQIDSIEAELELLRSRKGRYNSSEWTIDALRARENELLAKKEALLRAGAQPILTGNYTSSGTSSVRPVSNVSISYNASVAREAYFTPNQSLMNDFSAGLRRDNYIYASNSPTVLNDAMSLWRTATQGGKGVIQTWLPPDGIPQVVKENNYAAMDVPTTFQRAGMRFMYNPETIGMAYGQIAEADPLFIAAGRGTALPFAAASSSTIALTIPINRMFDLKYITPNGGVTAGNRLNSIWSGRAPSPTERKEIYERGTMYDIEYLLLAMFPYGKLDTQFRGKSADIGFLGNFPVEMHLGKSLRYVTQITSMQLTHQIFDHRMVPVYTTLQITASRIPDYTGISSTTSGGGGTSTNGGVTSIGRGSGTSIRPGQSTGAIGRPGGIILQ